MKDGRPVKVTTVQQGKPPKKKRPSNDSGDKAGPKQASLDLPSVAPDPALGEPFIRSDGRPVQGKFLR